MDEHDIGELLRALRHERGETLEQVSESTGLSVAMLSRVERGERLPSPESVEVLAAHFGLPAEELMGQTIANRMLNRYGRASSNRAAERLTGSGRTMGLLPEDVETDRRYAAMPMPRSVRGFSARPVGDLFAEDRVGLIPPAATGPAPESDPALEALADAARVAEVALESAVAAARRAIASGDPQRVAEGRRVLERLQRRLEP